MSNAPSTRLTPEQSETAARMLADRKVAAMLNALGRRLCPTLGWDTVESLKHRAVFRAARKHRGGPTAYARSVRRFWDWEVKSELTAADPAAVFSSLPHPAGSGDAADAGDPVGSDDWADRGRGPRHAEDGGQSLAFAERLAAVSCWLGDRLTGQEATAVRLRFLAGMSLAEVAVALGVCEWTAQRIIKRSLRRLRHTAAAAGFPVAEDEA